MADPTGGLARRAGYADRYQSKQRHPILHVDVGNYFKPRGPGSDLINTLMSESLGDLPIKVLSLTAGDLAYWREHLSRTENPETHFISANLIPIEEAAPAPETHVVVSFDPAETGLSRTLRVAFLGLATPQRIRKNSGYRALDPVEAIGRVKDSVLARSDLQILLTELPREEIRRVIEAHGELDVVIRGERRFVLESAQTIQQTVVVTAVERGRSLGQLRLDLQPDLQIGSAILELIEMGSGVVADPQMAVKEAQLVEKLP